METQFLRDLASLCKKLWSYLQGMETTKDWRAESCKSCFDPTYKGWKLGSPLRISVINSSFDPTYKGWKLITVCLKNSNELSFDPTYKGWKPGGIRKFRSICLALILPTRDGNRTPEILCTRLETELWSYLQGMETTLELWDNDQNT